MAKKNTGLIIGLSVLGVGVLAGGGGLFWWLSQKQKTEQKQLEQHQSAGDAAARIAEANAEADIARAQAQAAKAVADAQKGSWYAPIMGGLGTAIGEFNWSSLVPS